MELLKDLKDLEKYFDDTSFEGYEEEYIEEYKEIWDVYVPKNGPSNCVQGELLRQEEKLRYEAQNNGNINWDDNFEYFCEFIFDQLVIKSTLDEELKEILCITLNRIMAHGKYARDLYDGIITDDEFDPVKIAYVEDDLYNLISDAIGEFYINNLEPIPYTPKEGIYR